MTMDPDPVNVIREHALRLLDRRAYSCGELAKRLVAGGHERRLVDLVIDRLVECGLLDDAAYARVLAEAAVRTKPASAALIEQKLATRHIAPEIAQRVAAEVLAGVDPVEAAADLARSMLAARRGRCDRTNMQRIAAGLARRGFDADIIEEAIERAGLTLPMPDDSFSEEHGP